MFLRTWKAAIRDNVQTGEMSLKARLWAVFATLMVLAIAFSAILVYQQHRTAVTGTQIAMSSNHQMNTARQMRDALMAVDRKADRHQPLTVEVENFRKILKKAISESVTPESAELLDRMRQRFEAYVLALNKGGTVDIRLRWEEVAAQVAAFVELNENTTYRMAGELIAKQESSIKLALTFLSVFIFLMLFAGYKVIGVITRPLSSLARFVDQLDLEEEIPSVLPRFDHGAPEIDHVAKSFERLLVRLKGYRALNVRRLLIEKRRADIIAASISDGIFLLKGEEIVYLNPIAERILGIGPLPLWASVAATVPSGRVTLSGLITQSLANDVAGGGKPSPASRGARAVLEAVSRAIPVEFSLEGDERKRSYLIQAVPISFDLVEQVEHSVSGPISQVLERFQASTLVVAQDVTLVKESQDAKGHFLATLSHEIKTPVTSLTMATKLLAKSLEQIENPTHRTLIKTCADDVDRLRVLLDDLLTVTHFDMLTQRLHVQMADLVKLLRHTVQGFQPTANERGIHLNWVVQKGSKHTLVPMDPAKVAWALSNLLTNALRHTPKGGKVQARAEFLEDCVEVRIQDSGPGIDRSRQGRIFDKYSPFYDIRVARSGSAGAGLSIAREIVVAHGGKIWVSSEPGAGAEFCFTLPLKRAGSESKENSMHNVSQAFPSNFQNYIDKKSSTSSLAGVKGVSSGATACSG